MDGQDPVFAGIATVRAIRLAIKLVRRVIAPAREILTVKKTHEARLELEVGGPARRQESRREKQTNQRYSKE
jgi:isoaspartyl peptidase/L-asparaginase-like protein (Ntn-hydrolase superfamily)